MMAESKIKVLIIGKDGIARKYWVNHDAEFYDNKYKIDYDAVYQSVEGWWRFTRSVPTIMFRENNVIAISHRVRASIPDPDEMGSSISRAAWAIAELMRKGNENMQLMLLIAVIAACIIAGAGAVLSYNTGRQVTDLKVQISDLSAQIQYQSNTTQQNPNGGMPIPIIPIATPTVVHTVAPTVSGTPLPAISVS
jgi:hypothetical protein